MSSIPEYPVPMYSPATLVIDLGHLRSNLVYFRTLLSQETRIMVMVKADAYGCGAIEVSRVLEEMGVRDLGVAYTHEGIALREAGIEAHIMVMNPLPQEFPDMIKYQLEPELWGFPLLQQWMQFVQSTNPAPHPVHLEVDTGMRRLGFDLNEGKKVGSLLRSHPSVRVRSVFSHLAASADPAHDDFTRKQFRLFEQWYADFEAATGWSPMRHILNTGGIIRFPGHQYDMVRLGIGLYGVGMESLPDHASLRPVQSLYASISQIRDIGPQETVGYHRKGWLERPGRIAVVNLGYADGFPRLAGNGRFSVLIAGVLCPVVGTVCMDMLMVDISDCPEAQPGSVAEIYGPGNPVAALAEAAQTIPYEVITGNHQRLRRIYL